jgi:hypothetical protein
MKTIAPAGLPCPAGAVQLGCTASDKPQRVSAQGAAVMLACLSRLHHMPSLFDGVMVFLDTGSAAGALMVAAAPIFKRFRATREGHTR